MNIRGIPSLGGGSNEVWTRVDPVRDLYGWTQGPGGSGVFVPEGSLDRFRQGAKPAFTTLAAAMTDTVSGSVTVSTPDAFPPISNRVLVDTEELFVTAGQGTTSWTVLRGSNATTAATHALGAKVFGESFFKLAIVGDSTAQNTTNSNGNGWDSRLARALARWLGVPNINPQLGTGYYPVFRSADNNLGGNAGNSDARWSVPSGTWPLANLGGIIDWAAFGWTASAAAGATNVLKWTPPANVNDIKCVDVIFADGFNLVWSYSLDGGTTWTNAPIAGLSNVAILRRQRITSATPITDFRIRAADSAATGHATRILGLRAYAAAPVFGVDQGIETWNFAKDLDFLATFVRTNASGDNFRQFDSDQGSLIPDLAIIGPFTNDVTIGTWTGGTSSSAAVNYLSRLNTVIARLKPYCDIILMAAWEQNTRSVVDQQTLRTTLHNAAIANNVAYFDVYDAWSADGITGWAQADAAGFMGPAHDNFHVAGIGHQDVAARLARMITIKA